MSDLIDRQAAIDATWKDTGYTDPFNVMTAIRDRIKQLPPIQPEPSEECERCMMEHMDNMEKLEVELAQAKMQLPPIQPKRGRWIYCEDSMADCVDGYRCDQCGFFVPWDYKHKGIDFIQDYNFCPHCGAKMEVTT